MLMSDEAQKHSLFTHRDGVLPRMPARVQDLLVEVERLQSHVLPHASRSHTVLHAGLVTRKGTTDLLRLER